jgi:hypothetical protein
MLSGTGSLAWSMALPPRLDIDVSPSLWRVQASSSPVNAASVSLQMIPDKTVGIGGKVSFRVTARKAGYVVLVDVDAAGRMTQIFPTAELLAQSGDKDINFVRPGEELQIPTPAARQRGFEYVITPPTGAAVMVAVWSERRVQRLDLPDMPRKLPNQTDALNYLAAWTSGLRVPDGSSGKLLPSNWSFDIKAYSIQ